MDCKDKITVAADDRASSGRPARSNIRNIYIYIYMIIDKKTIDFKTVLGEPFTGPFTVDPSRAPSR